MNEELRTKITDKLRAFLKREPNENEIINAQTDSNIMQWIAQDEAAEQKSLLEAVALQANVDIEAVKTSLNNVV